MAFAPFSPNFSRHSAFSSSRVFTFLAWGGRTDGTKISEICGHVSLAVLQERKTKGADAYVGSWFKVRTVHRVVVEAGPLLECIEGLLVVLFGVPLEHAGVVFDAHAFAVRLDYSGGVVE